MEATTGFIIIPNMEDQALDLISPKSLIAQRGEAGVRG
jgi:hypothetical protein